MSNKYSLSGNKKKSPLSSLLKIILELIIIIIGIYIAFQLENGKERRQTEALEKKYLEQLLEEAKINQSELEADQDARRIQLEYLRKLVETTNRTVAPDTLRNAMKQLLMIRLYSPTDAVYQDLVSSGNLGIIKSDTIKLTLFNYRRYLSRVPLTEESDLQMIADQLEPYLIEKKVLSLLEAHDNIPEIDISQQQTDRIIRSLLNDRAFIDLVYLRIHKVRDAIYFENPMQWRLRELITLLEAELSLLENR